VLRDEIARVCGAAVEWASPEAAELVVVSRDPALSDDTLRRLGGNRGARLLATCRDGEFPQQGQQQEGPGRTVIRVEQAMGRTARVLGKPNPYVLRRVMGLTPAQRAATLVVGDSPDQDVGLGRRAGCPTVLLADAASPMRGPRPDHRIHRLDQLLELITEVRG
jgi:arabinose operon protein AraL